MDQLTGSNVLKPIKIDAARRVKFATEHVCSICRYHPSPMPTDERDKYVMLCAHCGHYLMEGNYISVHDLRKQEADEYDTRSRLRKPSGKSETDLLKDLGF